MAFALLFVMASISSTSLTLLGAALAAGAYIGGTLLKGSPLIYQGDTGNLIGAAMLIINALAACSIGEAFGSFVMRLHRLEAEICDTKRAPKKVRNMEPQPRAATAATPASNVRARPRSGWRAVLTARQLEVAFLVRDGLHQDEIAACLSISRRQVERLLQQARERSGAATTGELVAMLVRSQFVPPVRDAIWCEDLTDLAGPPDLASSSA
jgi:DNA-binding CsgD family transcriptional regulator